MPMPAQVEDIRQPRAPLGEMAVRQPVEELLRLARESEMEERVERERGIAQPGVAVVPVARTADGLGEAGRGRGQNRPRRRVREQLEDQSRTPDRLTIWAVIRDLLDPAPPILLAGAEEPARHLHGPARMLNAPGAPGAQREGSGLSRVA